MNWFACMQGIRVPRVNSRLGRHIATVEFILVLILFFLFKPGCPFPSFIIIRNVIMKNIFSGVGKRRRVGLSGGSLHRLGSQRSLQSACVNESSNLGFFVSGTSERLFFLTLPSRAEVCLPTGGSATCCGARPPGNMVVL